MTPASSFFLLFFESEPLSPSGGPSGAAAGAGEAGMGAGQARGEGGGSSSLGASSTLNRAEPLEGSRVERVPKLPW